MLGLVRLVFCSVAEWSALRCVAKHVESCYMKPLEISVWRIVKKRVVVEI